MRNVFIGSTVRCGGSLLARLFDHMPSFIAWAKSFSVVACFLIINLILGVPSMSS